MCNLGIGEGIASETWSHSYHLLHNSSLAGDYLEKQLSGKSYSAQTFPGIRIRAQVRQSPCFAQLFTSYCDLFLCEEGYHPLAEFSKQDVSSGDAATQPLEPSRRITAEEDLSKYPAAVPRVSSRIQISQATTRN